MLEIVNLAIPDVKLIRTRRFTDDRGFFTETYNRRDFLEAGVCKDFVQDNHALSTQRGTLRGLHFQRPPQPQAKLVRVARGAIFDVAVDIRRGSPSYGRHVAVTLTADGGEQLLIPIGFAHGYCTLEPKTEIIYKVDAYFAPDCDAGIAADDPELGIAWPIDFGEMVLSAKDRKLPRLIDLDDAFLHAGATSPHRALTGCKTP